MATQSIRYWDVRIKRKGECNSRDLVLNFYLRKSDVDRHAHDKPLSIQECIKQLNFSRQKLKDVVANAKEYRGKYEVEIAEAIVEKRNAGFKDGEICDPVGKRDPRGKGGEDTRKPSNGPAVMAQDGTTNTGTSQAKFPQTEYDHARRSAGRDSLDKNRK
jgi:hypothetical protein